VAGLTLAGAAVPVPLPVAAGLVGFFLFAVAGIAWIILTYGKPRRALSGVAASMGLVEVPKRDRGGISTRSGLPTGRQHEGLGHRIEVSLRQELEAIVQNGGKAAPPSVRQSRSRDARPKRGAFR
jgi:hypothetical protein